MEIGVFVKEVGTGREAKSTVLDYNEIGRFFGRFPDSFAPSSSTQSANPDRLPRLRLPLPVCNSARQAKEVMVQPTNLRPASGPKTCNNCMMYKSLDDYKGMVSQFGAQSALVLSYGYGPEYLSSDGICEVSGDPPVLRSQVCDNYIPL